MFSVHQGQFRWDGKTPYSKHPLEVVEIMKNTLHIEDEDMLIAGYLHDVVEDTNTTITEIKDKFGIRVADFVQQLTFEEGGDDEYYWNQISGMTQNAKKIKLADILANLNSPGKQGEHFRLKQVKAIQIILRSFYC